VRSIKFDLRDMRAGLGRRKSFQVGEKKAGGGFVVALPEEISIANVFIGERRLERKRRRALGVMLR